LRFDTVDRGTALRSSALRRKDPMKNLLTDISGVRVGHADDTALASGVTAVVFDQPAVAAIELRVLSARMPPRRTVLLRRALQRPPRVPRGR